MPRFSFPDLLRLTALSVVLLPLNFRTVRAESSGAEAGISRPTRHSDGLPILLPADTLRFAPQRRNLVWEGGIAVGKVLEVDKWQKMWIHETGMRSVTLGLRHRTTPLDTDAFAADFGFPEWSLHLSIGDYSGVKMQKLAKDWGEKLPVDYVSDMGTVIALYGAFSRPLWRSGRWQLGYQLEEGLAYNTRPYDPQRNVDNELTGSHLLLHFGASLYARFRLSPRWAVRADLAFRHVSNGATDRPNKGANALMPNLSVQYALDGELPLSSSGEARFAPFRPYWYGSFGVSVGGRTLLEEWLRTQYKAAPADPDYRTGDFRFYPTYNVQADLMRRYARRWASGVGIDFFYMPYVDRLRTLDGGDHRYPHDRFSYGFAAKHEVFYGALSLYVSLGWYLHRDTGSQQPHDETPYYERVGLRYAPRALRGWSVGLGIKAHRTKADFTEILLSRRI